MIKSAFSNTTLIQLSVKSRHKSMNNRDKSKKNLSIPHRLHHNTAALCGNYIRVPGEYGIVPAPLRLPFVCCSSLASFFH